MRSSLFFSFWAIASPWAASPACAGPAPGRLAAARDLMMRDDTTSTTTTSTGSGSGSSSSSSGVAEKQQPRRLSTEMGNDDGDDAQAEPLVCFQVQSPVLLPQGAVVDNHVVLKPPPSSSSSSATRPCEVLLMEHHFGNSYGQPFVASYTPPDCPFTRAVLNFTAVSEGRQFDRLAVMYLGDTEVWRTSTAEPTSHPGIVWTHLKDVTPYLSLWRQPQTLIFDLGNLVNDKYTGLFNTTLTVTFIHDDDNDDDDDDDGDLRGPAAKPADQIVPLSARCASQGKPSAFTYPSDGDKPSIPVTLPQNVQRAVVSVSANGQADEEFWWANVPDSSAGVFNDTPAAPLPGHSSFREVQLLIDGQLAGLAWPFPVVFTGGISPPLHRPVVGLQAFDLREQEIDVSPWLGLLCDGRQHVVSFRIVDPYDLVVPSYWVLSGKMFLWLDNDKDKDKSSPIPQAAAAAPSVQVNQPSYQASLPTALGGGAYRYTQTVTRSLQVTSRRHTWSQTFSMQNDGYLADGGNFQQVNALYAGRDSALLDGRPYFRAAYEYPIDMLLNTTGPTADYSLRLDAQLLHGLQLTVTGPTAFSTGLEPFMHKLRSPSPSPSSSSSAAAAPSATPPYGSSLSTFRKGSAVFYQFNNGQSSSGYGDTRQIFRFGAAASPPPLPASGDDDDDDDYDDFTFAPLLYMRDVTAQREVITSDYTYIYKADVPPPPTTNSRFAQQLGANNSSNNNINNRTGEFAPLPAQQRGGVKVFFGSNVAEQASEAVVGVVTQMR